MRIVEYSLILCCLFLKSNGLNCRSEGGPKESELKKIYNVCIKQQNKSNTGNNNEELDQDWKETRRYNQWSQDNMARNREYDNSDYRIDESGHGEGNRMDFKDRAEGQYELNRQDRTSKHRDNRMQYGERHGDERTYSRDGRDNGDNKFQRDGLNDRNDFFRNENYDGHNNYYSTQSPRRYKRERRVEVNSGKRSQYNPNPQRFSEYEDKYKDENKNSSERNSTSEDDRSCAVHCLLENFHMIGENGMPDRYLVTHAITKDVKDEDLKDFLEESIEECFQILDNEKTDEKCEFSKNLMMCLSEKGRANCDDWKDDFQF